MLPSGLLVLVALSTVSVAESEVKELRGIADFKEVYLSWTSNNGDEKESKFDVQHCENLPWGRYNCQRKVLDSNSGLFREITVNPNVYKYGTVVNGLRMATSYTFRVASALKSRYHSSDRARSINNEIALTTKGFSAEATKCEANFTDVKVQTGPYFGGRISVENTSSPGCSIQGNSKSSQKSYTLRINHYECQSDVTSNSVSTFILVQEINSILTHSMGRFMVICKFNYLDVFTVKASVNLPSEGRRGKSKDLDELIIDVDEHKKSKYGILSKKNYLERKAEAAQVSQGDKHDKQAAQLVLMVILVVAALVGCSATIWWFVTSSRIRHNRGFLDPQLELEHAGAENAENSMRDTTEVAISEEICTTISPIALVSIKRIEEIRHIAA